MAKESSKDWLKQKLMDSNSVMDLKKGMMMRNLKVKKRDSESLRVMYLDSMKQIPMDLLMESSMVILKVKVRNSVNYLYLMKVRTMEKEMNSDLMKQMMKEILMARVSLMGKLKENSMEILMEKEKNSEMMMVKKILKMKEK